MATAEHPHTPNYKESFPEIDSGKFHASPKEDLGWIGGLYSTALSNIILWYGQEKQLDPNSLTNFKPDELMELLPFKEAPFIIYVGGWLLVAIGISVYGCKRCCCGKKRTGRTPGGTNEATNAQPTQSQQLSAVESGPADIENAGEATEPIKSEGTLEESAHVDTENTGEAVNSPSSQPENTRTENAGVAVSSAQPPMSQRLGDMRSKMQGKISGKEPLILTGLMGLWLFMWFLIIIYSFGTPGWSKEAAEDIDTVLKNGFDDAHQFLNKSVEQMDLMYKTNFDKFAKAIEDVMGDCDTSITTPSDATCAKLNESLTEPINGPMVGAKESLKESTLTDFRDNLIKIRDVVASLKDKFKEVAKDYVAPATRYLYYVLVLFNILYLFIFLAVLFGMIFIVLGMKLSWYKLQSLGRLAVKGAILAMCILPVFIWLQMTLIFTIQGMLTARACPRLVPQEGSPKNLSVGNNYIPPTYPDTMGRCKNDETAYYAFNFYTDNKTSPDGHKAKVTAFHTALDPVEQRASGTPSSDPTKKNVKQTTQEIFYQAEAYINEFLIPTVIHKAGKCLIGYNAIYSLVSLLCIRLPGPLLGYLFLLNFVMPLFILMMVTWTYFERFHFQ